MPETGEPMPPETFRPVSLRVASASADAFSQVSLRLPSVAATSPVRQPKTTATSVRKSKRQDPIAAVARQKATRQMIEPVLQARLSEMADRITAFADLPEDWSKYGKRPSGPAISLAHQVAELVARHGHTPYKVTAIAEGGIALRFQVGERHALVEMTNDQEMAIAMQSSAESPTQFSDAESVRAAALALAEFLGE